MPPEPPVKRAVAFMDGQNLFHAAKEAFGYRWPNFDPLKLAREMSRLQGWTLGEARFYTGVPDRADEPSGTTSGRPSSRRWARRSHQLLARSPLPKPDRPAP